MALVRNFEIILDMFKMVDIYKLKIAHRSGSQGHIIINFWFCLAAVCGLTEMNGSHFMTLCFDHSG
jgi:hypothetical protein